MWLFHIVLLFLKNGRKLRRKYGNEKPFKVKYVGLGNEIDGPWQMGQKSAEDYCKFALEAGKLISWVDRDIKLVSCQL